MGIDCSHISFLDTAYISQELFFCVSELLSQNQEHRLLEEKRQTTQSRTHSISIAIYIQKEDKLQVSEETCLSI